MISNILSDAQRDPMSDNIHPLVKHPNLFQVQKRNRIGRTQRGLQFFGWFIPRSVPNVRIQCLEIT